MASAGFPDLKPTPHPLYGARSVEAMAGAAVVGDGVVVEPSRLSAAGVGNGLFASRAFEKDDLVTCYEGPTIEHARAKSFSVTRASHVLTLRSLRTAIDGLRVPVEGRGGGSFANDGRGERRPNAVFETFLRGRDLGVEEDAVYLRALRRIRPGDEVLVSYGTRYWSLRE